MQGLAIAAFVVSIIAIFTPWLGVLMSGLSGILASACYKSGSPYAIAALVLNVLNLTLLSPVFFGFSIALLFEDSKAPFAEEATVFSVAFLILLCIQIVGLVLFYRYKRVNKLMADPKEGVKPTRREKKRIEPTLD